MSEGSSFGNAPSQDSRSNSSQAYLNRAALAVEQGDNILGIHLYLAAYERALSENLVPGEEVLKGMGKAWDLALRTKQRSLAEYIFEKLEPYWNPDEVTEHADELQRLAFDKLEEYGFDREAIEDMADMVNQDLLDAAPDVLCEFQESEPPASDPAPAPAPEPAPASDAPTALKGQSDADAAQIQLPNLPGLSAFLGQFAPSKSEATPEQRLDYRNLVGFDGVIRTMNEMGIGRSRDPEFAQFLEMLNRRHGLSGMPGVGTLMFSCPAREDANYFMVATAGELDMPAVRMRLDHNAQGQVVLCVMASPDFKPRLQGLQRTGFDEPTTVILEDLDLWDFPAVDTSTPESAVQGLIQMQLSRGAREALALIQTALDSPEATVMISASEPKDIDPFFWELIGPYRMIDVDLPNEAERRAIWREVQSQHPSARGLDVSRMVEFSHTLSRFEILMVANEAVEEAYRNSVAKGKFCAVSSDDVMARLASFQPLDSSEYKTMEDIAVEEFRRETSNFDDLLKG